MERPQSKKTHIKILNVATSRKGSSLRWNFYILLYCLIFLNKSNVFVSIINKFETKERLHIELVKTFLK